MQSLHKPSELNLYLVDQVPVVLPSVSQMSGCAGSSPTYSQAHLTACSFASVMLLYLDVVVQMDFLNNDWGSMGQDRRGKVRCVLPFGLASIFHVRDLPEPGADLMDTHRRSSRGFRSISMLSAVHLVRPQHASHHCQPRPRRSDLPPPFRSPFRTDETGVPGRLALWGGARVCRCQNDRGVESTISSSLVFHPRLVDMSRAKSPHAGYDTPPTDSSGY